MQQIQRFDRWGFPIRMSEAELYRRVVLGQKARPLNIKFVPQSDAIIFSINPLVVPDSKITAIRVQDLARNEEFNWDNGVWDKAPEVTVGIGTLYIAFYAVNNGGPGDVTFQMRAGAQIVAQKTVHVPAGAGDGVESGTISMPDSVYDIWIAVAP